MPIKRIGFGAQNLATAVSAMVLGLTMSATAATPLAWPDGWSDAFGNEAGIDIGAGGIDSYTKLVLHADGTDGSVTVTDSSSAPHTVTVGGNAQIDTAQSKLGSGSLLFDGTGDYLTLDGSADFHFGTSDWTMDFWLRLSVATGVHNLVDFKPNTTGAVYPQIYVSSGTIIYRVNGADRISGATLAAGTWYHIAVAKSAGNTKMFIDGVQSGSTYADANDYLAPAANRPVIGANAGLADSLNGWLDEFRISKGIARWTANFTPPVGPYSITAYSSNFVYNATTDVYSPSFTPVVMIAAATGTNIGDATSGGGLAAAFDGTTLRATTDTATLAFKGTTPSIYVGKNYSSSPKVIGKAIAYGSSNGGFVNTGGTDIVTLTLYGKNGGAPANGTDGTVLGTTGAFAQSVNESAGRTITSSSYASWDYVWVYVTSAANPTGTYIFAEIQFFPQIIYNNMTLQAITRAFPPGTPKAARLLVGIIENDTTTINTDFTAKLSRDGTTWKTATLVYSHTDGSTKYYVASNVNLQTGAGSGTNIVAKFETANNKNIDVSGYDIRLAA